jgi:hypothetical protein
MKINWHKTETREVRPFYEVADLTDALRAAEIRLFDGSPFVAQDSFSLGDQELRRLSPSIKPNLDLQKVKSSKAIKPSQLALVVSATNPFLKRTRLVAKTPLSQAPDEEYPVEAEVLEALGGGANLQVDISLCLDQSLSARAGRPFIQGHWIARKTFGIRSAKLNEDFDVEPLDDEGWKNLGLPPKTLYLVDYIGGINEPLKPDQPIAKVFIHADVYRRIATENNPRAVRALQALLASEITNQMLVLSAKDWENVEQAEKQSPLNAFLKRINKNHRVSLQELHELASKAAPKLKAMLQADLEVVRAIVEG